MAAKEHLLTIDCGTQSLRAMIFDTRGNQIAKAKVPFKPYVSVKPGYAEQDPDVYWRALCRACLELWQQPGVQKSALIGMAVTTQRGTLINVDRAGKPLRPAIIWLDQRTTESEKPIGGLWGAAFKLAGVSDTVKYLQANAESNWLKTHQPEIWKNTHKFLLLSGYLNYRLTGNYNDSVSNQVAYLPFDYKQLAWAKPSDWKWQATSMRPELLPELIQPGTELGRILPEIAEETGIPVNLPVVAAATDKACEVLGSGSLSLDTGCLSYGTTATFNVTSRKYLEAVPFIPPYPAAIPNAYSMEVQIFRGYWMVEWFKQEFAHKEMSEALHQDLTAEQLLEELIRPIPAGCEGLMVQPYWTPGIKVPGPEARGTILGFSDVHTRGHLYRAILEGMAFALREGKERVEKKTGCTVTSLRVSGGGSQSDTALQITADIFGLPAIRPHTFETSGLGAAMILAVGKGIYANFEQAIGEMCHTSRTFEPNMGTRKTYESLYHDVYLKVYQRMKPLYVKIKELF